MRRYLFVTQKTVKVPVFTPFKIFSMAVIKILGTGLVINSIAFWIMPHTFVLFFVL